MWELGRKKRERRQTVKYSTNNKYTRKTARIDICPQTLCFRYTAHTFTGPQSCWEIANSSAFSSTCERKVRSPTHFYGCQTIRNHPRTFERVRQSVIRRAHACVPSGGGHFGSLCVTGQAGRTGQLLNWERVLWMCCVSCGQNVVWWRYLLLTAIFQLHSTTPTTFISTHTFVWSCSFALLWRRHHDVCPAI